MLYKFTLVSLITLWPAAAAWAQRPAQGFVVTSAGDTIRGELFQTDKDARNQVINLKPASGPATAYTAATIRAYGRAGYAPVESKTYGPTHAPILAEPLVKGPVSLYKGYQAAAQDARYGQDIRYYLQLPDSTQLQVIEPANLALSMHKLIGNCPTIDFSQRLAKQPKAYSTPILTKAVNDYTACRHAQPAPAIAPAFHGWYTSWGVKGGINQTALTTAKGDPFSTSVESASSAGWQVGIFGILANWNGFAIQGEAQLVQLHASLSAPIYTGTGSYTLTRSADIKLRQLRLPLQLRYQLGHGVVRPFVLAGPHLGYDLGHSETIVDKRSDQPTSTTNDLQWLPNGLALGLQGGGGLYLALPKGPGISLEAGYSRGQQGSNRDQLLYKGLSFNAAAYF